MTDVTVLGAGEMGRALARAFVRSGHPTTVWNRTPQRAAALATEGISLAQKLDDAVAASPLLVACVSGPLPLQELDLTGRTFVQLSTATPQGARDEAQVLVSRGADVLFGAILAVPIQIGTPASSILVSGSPSARAAAASLLARAGTVTFVGQDPGAASAFDLGFLSTLFAALVGSYHGARVFEREGLPVSALGAMLERAAPAIGAMLKHDTEVIEHSTWAEPQSSLETCRQGLLLMERHAEEAQLDPLVPRFLRELFDRGARAGLGDQSPAALVQILRGAR